ncbi:hypothetical protein [Cytobacillus kochii]|uniref:hypothetical protein n=1 Tax=Cytobacillus kochii TaxID=859143 RepID=UPI001CD2EADE|nr:hypothetical protein [Cytobacillus kochii]MCA1027462.1 hypothetical protein [Cytobacillus kochii]MCM3322030.1 hypothetical protein [Cytobacillus kochii]MCM3343138.1 hypothetical protein [Cytobacillus kochii]
MSEEPFFNQFMFGNRDARQSEDWILGRQHKQEEEKSPSILNTIEQLDLVELMANMSQLMDSAEELKPLLKHAAPIVEVFMNKKS